jgi:hypothetical protein
MPLPQARESRSHFVSRAIDQLIAEGLTQKAAVGKAEGMFSFYTAPGGGSGRKKRYRTGNRRNSVAKGFKSVTKWMQGAVHPSRVGQFTAKAKRAGYSTALAYANAILAHRVKVDKLTFRQALFAHNAGGASKARARA